MRSTASAASTSGDREDARRDAENAAAIPLIAQPGAEWNYSIATDVLGQLVAVLSGQPFDEFLRERSSARSA